MIPVLPDQLSATRADVAPAVPEWLTSDEAAARARRNVGTIRRAVVAGRIHGHQTCPGGPWRFRPAAVDAYVTGADGEAACGCTRLQLVRGRKRAS